MRKLLGLLILLAPLCAHAQFAKIQGGPLVGNCNPHTLGMDFVNNNIYECDGEPVPQWKLVGGINNQGIIPVLLRTNSPNCTTTNQLVQYDPGHVDSAGVGEVTNASVSSKNVIGVVISGAGCSGVATIGTYLSAQCIADGTTTLGDLVAPSAVTPGLCSDYGSTVSPNVQTVGRVSKASTGPGGVAQVDFFLGDLTSPGSSSGSGTVSNCGTPGGIAYYVTAGNVIGCDPNFTTDGSGNWTSHSGTVNDTSHAGYLNIIQGATPPTAPTNGVQLSVPTSVTGYTFYVPGTKPTSGNCASFAALSGQIQLTDAGFPCGSGGGSVTSVGFSINSLSSSGPFAVTGSPVTSTGTLNLNANLQGGDTKVLTSGTVSGTGSVLCTDATGGATTSGCINPQGASTLNNPSTPTVTPTGTTGAASYTYGIVGCEDTSCAYHSAISGTGSTSTGNATLSNSNYNALTLYGDTLYGYRGYIACRLTGGSTQGVITGGLQAGKKFNDTGLSGNGANCASLYASNTTLTYPFCLGSSLPGYPSVPGAPCGADGPPLSPTAYDQELTQTFGAPADVNDGVFTKVNFGSATAAWTNGDISLTLDAGGGSDAIRGLVESTALPSTPYTYIVYVDAMLSHNNNQCGIIFRESGSSKSVTFGFQQRQPIGNTTAGSGFTLNITNWTNDTTAAGNPGSPVGLLANMPIGGIYLKLQNTGTNIVASWSNDGISYSPYTSFSVASVFTSTPNQVGVYGDPYNATAGDVCAFDYLRRTQ